MTSPVVEGCGQRDHLRHPVVALLAAVQAPDLLPVMHVDDADGRGSHVGAVHVDKEAKLPERETGRQVGLEL